MIERIRIGFPILPKAKPKPYQFQHGHKHVGRPVGSRNKHTTILKDAILLAASLIGSDKKGKDGLVGYLKRASIDYPRDYLVLIGKVLQLQLLGSINVEDGKVYTTEEAEAILKERGIRIRAHFDQPLPESELPLDNLSNLSPSKLVN